MKFIAILAVIATTEAISHHHKSTIKKESDELCDGDRADDVGIDDPLDKADHNNFDAGFGLHRGNGFVQISIGEAMRKINHRRHNKNLLQYNFDAYQDGIANGDSADNKDNQSEGDNNDNITDENGTGHARYGSKNMEKMHAENSITELFPEHYGTVPRADFLNYRFDSYQDALANGDSSDAKDNQSESDIHDYLVDENGTGHARYGSKNMEQMHADNSITNLFSEHYGTVPRAD